MYLYTKNKLTAEGTLQPGDPKIKDGRLGLVPIVLSPETIHSITTIQLNLPSHAREAQSPKVVEAMYLELMNRFDFGRKFNNLNPIEEMEIEFDPDQDKIDIQELVVNEQDLKQQLSQPDLADIPKATRE